LAGCLAAVIQLMCEVRGVVGVQYGGSVVLVRPDYPVPRAVRGYDRRGAGVGELNRRLRRVGIAQFCARDGKCFERAVDVGVVDGSIEVGGRAEYPTGQRGRKLLPDVV